MLLVANRLKVWLVWRLLRWNSPSLDAFGHWPTLRWVASGRLSDCGGESIVDAFWRRLESELDEYRFQRRPYEDDDELRERIKRKIGS